MTLAAKDWHIASQAPESHLLAPGSASGVSVAYRAAEFVGWTRCRHRVRASGTHGRRQRSDSSATIAAVKLIFSEEADQDVEAIDAWWRENRLDAPRLFAEERQQWDWQPGDPQVGGEYAVNGLVIDDPS